jgi:hypothetical protein
VPGQHAVHPPPGHPLDHCQAGGEQAAIAAELVDDEAGHQGLIRGLQQRDGAEQRREHPAAVDVADDDRRQPGVPRQAHVDVVARPQVDLGGAARAFRDDDVVPRGEVVVRGVGGRGEVPAAHLPVARVNGAAWAAHQHDVAAPVAAGLEQDRVHRRLGRDPRGQRLHPLGAPHLRGAAVSGAVDGGAHHRVVRHVLRLVRRHPDPAAGERPAQPGRDDALPGVRRGAGDKQPAHQAG